MGLGDEAARTQFLRTAGACRHRCICATIRIYSTSAFLRGQRWHFSSLRGSRTASAACARPSAGPDGASAWRAALLWRPSLSTSFITHALKCLKHLFTSVLTSRHARSEARAGVLCADGSGALPPAAHRDADVVAGEVWQLLFARRHVVDVPHGSATMRRCGME